MTDSFCDVIVIGGGAAGMMCAIEAGKRGRKVILLEHNDHVGKKIGISGGGRCNFTNLNAGPENYVSNNPDFCKSALARYTPWDFIALVEEHGIPYHEKKLGQQFCDTSSREIINLLTAECQKAGVEIRVNCRVHDVSKGDRFRANTSTGTILSQSLVIATGGLSFAKLGASDFGYRIGQQFGHTLTTIRPGLVPLTWAPDDKEQFEPLSGVSIPVIARAQGVSFTENLLFTHRGISGPVVLQVSSFWKEGQPVELDLLPDSRVSGQEWLANARSQNADVLSLLSREWPRRFAENWCARHAPARPLAQWRGEEAKAFAHDLRNWTIHPAGTEGFPKAEVTIGGIDTTELSSKTMESRKVSGLFFVGEVMDVTGWLGGYNFQWAWASGFAAGQVA